MTNVVSLPLPAECRHTRWEMNAGNVPVNHTGYPAQGPPLRKKLVKVCPGSRTDWKGIQYAHSNA
jgi:hypothetical protein